MPSPLFAEAGRQVKRMLTEQFRRSQFGQLAQQVARTRRRPAAGEQVRYALRQFRRQATDPTAIIRGMMGAEFGQVVHQLRRYAKRDGDHQRAVQDFLGMMGPAGKLIQGLVGAPAGGSTATINREIRLAIDLIRAFGGEVLPGENWGSVEDVDRGLQAAQQRLSEFGVEFLPPGESERGTAARRPTSPETERRKFVTAEGKQYGVRPDHPLLTGEMVRTPRSTNVYEFGYDIESLFLYVRFQDHSGRSGGRRGGGGGGSLSGGGPPGALYRYHGVTPQEFLSLYAVRSKGGGGGPGDWVWDVLRVRGTVHAHHKDYALVGIMGGYVPRKATARPVYRTIGQRGQTLKRPRKIGEEPWYEQRTVRTHSGRMVTSVLPTARAMGPMGPR
jgi:hypothetical protein